MKKISKLLLITIPILLILGEFSYKGWDPGFYFPLYDKFSSVRLKYDYVSWLQKST